MVGGASKYEFMFSSSVRSMNSTSISVGFEDHMYAEDIMSRVWFWSCKGWSGVVLEL